MDKKLQLLLDRLPDWPQKAQVEAGDSVADAEIRALFERCTL